MYVNILNVLDKNKTQIRQIFFSIKNDSFINASVYACMRVRVHVHTATPGLGYLRDMCAVASRRVASRPELTVTR